MAKRRKRTNKNVPAKGRLRDMADKLWSKAVIEDWAAVCPMCGSRSNLNAHHLIPRQHTATRYTLRNGCCLCCHCHQFCPKRSPHLNAAGFMAWLAIKHPTLAEWYSQGAVESWSGHPPITKNADYYIDHIRALREYVNDDEYRRIVGVRLADWLDSE